MKKTFRSTRDFAEIADLIAAETAQTTDAFAEAFTSDLDGVRVTPWDEEVIADMPDPMQVQLATELMISTVFDVFRDTRLEATAHRIAWGIVDSMHRTARRVAGHADDTARQVQDLIPCADGSEIYATTLELAQRVAQEADEIADAIACMRDHAAAAYEVETGKPWSTARGSLVSSKRTASVIAAADYLAGRNKRRLDKIAPDGPLVLFSGPPKWQDVDPIYEELNRVKALIPNMLLLTTDLDVGADAIAKAWAAANNVTVVREDLPKGMGLRGGFIRNDRMIAKGPVDAIVCSGSGVQAALIRSLDEAGIEPRQILGRGDRPDWARKR